jgi:hypothetical protein
VRKWYRRLQLFFTALVLVPGAILLYFAYLSATTPSHSAAEAVILLLLGIALPPLIYWLWALIIWLKLGQEPGADPSSLAARIARKPYLAFIPVIIMLALIWLLNGFGNGIKDVERKPDVFVAMRQSCDEEATRALRQKGADPTTPALKALVDRYCSCVVIEAQLRYAPAEIEQMDKLDNAHLANDRKFAALIDKCNKDAEQR